MAKGSVLRAEFGLLCSDMMTEFGVSCFYVSIGVGGFLRWVMDIQLLYEIFVVFISCQVFCSSVVLELIGWLVDAICMVGCFDAEC